MSPPLRVTVFLLALAHPCASVAQRAPSSEYFLEFDANYDPQRDESYWRTLDLRPSGGAADHFCRAHISDDRLVEVLTRRGVRAIRNRPTDTKVLANYPCSPADRAPGAGQYLVTVTGKNQALLRELATLPGVRLRPPILADATAVLVIAPEHLADVFRRPEVISIVGFCGARLTRCRKTSHTRVGIGLSNLYERTPPYGTQKKYEALALEYRFHEAQFDEYSLITVVRVEQLRTLKFDPRIGEISEDCPVRSKFVDRCLDFRSNTYGVSLVSNDDPAVTRKTIADLERRAHIHFQWPPPMALPTYFAEIPKSVLPIVVDDPRVAYVEAACAISPNR